MYHSSITGATIKFLAILAILVAIVFIVESCNSSNAYNNGICQYCGGHLEFKQAVGHQYTTSYLYVCDKCGNMFESNTYFQR